jgi:4-phospho-D-threonate 3-dehydrogenase / 4-phospho-D-erythronate 3-dehydrogenase
MAYTQRRVVLGFTMGEPQGVGPWLVMKAMSNPGLFQLIQPVVVGDEAIMSRAAARAGIATDQLMRVSPVELTQWRDQPAEGRILLVQTDCPGLEMTEEGHASAAGGRAAFNAVREAFALAASGQIDALVTAPLSGVSLGLAGYPQRFHTSMLADFFAEHQHCTMSTDGDLRVVFVSTHIPLGEAAARITDERVFSVISMGAAACRRLGIVHPRIGVAGFNPHAGEGGVLGHEEKAAIIPAIRRAVDEGLDARGPFAPDVVFAKASSGAFDLVVAMYHDQGQIPLKMKNCWCGTRSGTCSSSWCGVPGINVTLGLPFVRTSVEFPAVFDAADHADALHAAMLKAIEYAALLAASPLHKKLNGVC